MSEVLKVLFEAAALCINTIRTFYLIVLAILGPLVFGIAVFDGFQHTLTVWIARYLNIFLWLPVANIFGGIMGKIQENMLKEDLQQIASNGDTFFSTTDTAYLIFMIIGIIGYFTVPSVANYIIHAGGNNALLQKVTHIMSTTVRNTASASAATDSLMMPSWTRRRGRPVSRAWIVAAIRAPGSMHGRRRCRPGKQGFWSRHAIAAADWFT